MVSAIRVAMYSLVFNSVVIEDIDQAKTKITIARIIGLRPSNQASAVCFNVNMPCARLKIAATITPAVVPHTKALYESTVLLNMTD